MPWIIRKPYSRLPTSSFFSIFSDEEKADITKLKNHILTFRLQELVIREGEIEPALFILRKGKVYINKTSRPHLKLAQLKPGDVFGEVAFVKNIAHSANAVAETGTVVLKINGKVFEKLNAEIQNKFRARFMDTLIDRLDNLNSRYLRDAGK